MSDDHAPPAPSIVVITDEEHSALNIEFLRMSSPARAKLMERLFETNEPLTLVELKLFRALAGPPSGSMSADDEARTWDRLLLARAHKVGQSTP